jgi:uncharacterized RDD family membrane protein YckC
MPYCKNCGAQLTEDAAYCQNCGTPVKGPSRPMLVTANWGERFVAWLIDIIIIGIFLVPFRFFFTLFEWSSFSIPIFPSSLSWFPLFWLGLDNIVYFLYWTIMEGTYGQSIGKMAMQLKVTRLNGQPIDMGYAAIESLGKAFLLPVDCFVGWLLYSNQRLFNYISDTIVVRSPR